MGNKRENDAADMNEIEKYLTSESAFAQNTQISQSVLYQAFLVETSNNLVLLPKAHEYSKRYLEDEYDALQASLKTIIEIVNYENILEIWRTFFNVFKILSNAKFDIKLIPRHWYSNSMQVYNSSPIRGTIVDHETSVEMNQVISIHGPDVYQPRICKNIIQKQEIKFCTTRYSNMGQEETLRPTKCANIEINNENIQPKLGTQH
ncbi:17315_t:CDS:2, partial [Gigaspora margarita]